MTWRPEPLMTTMDMPRTMRKKVGGRKREKEGGAF